MDKYLGNKRALLDSIFGAIVSRAPRARSICDAFAGTTNVARHFRQRGFDVIANDCNRASFVFGVAYLGLREWPQFLKLDVPASDKKIVESLRKSFLAAAKKDCGQTFPSENAEAVWEALEPYWRVLAYLNALPPLKSGPLTQHFTQWGRQANFVSVRGSSGKRNYFSRDNAGRLDAILQCLRNWWQGGRLTESEAHLLLAAVLEEVTIVANVNGTFHDFNRTRLWPNALQRLHIRVPLVSVAPTSAQIHCGDVLSVGPEMAEHDVLYLDPPYNFRQYSAYYHLLNFIAAYPFIPDLTGYLKNLTFVRGQNMADDFTSDFCFRDRFVSALGQLVDSMPCRYVCMSYYGGRNHWNHWSNTEKPTDLGLRHLTQFFSSTERFRGCEIFPALQVRRNYQSRGGEQKSLVDEHFFFAEKRTRLAVAQTPVDRVAQVHGAFELIGFRRFETGHYVAGNSKATRGRRVA